MEIEKLNQVDSKLIFSGNSTFTLLNEKSGNRFTYKIKSSKDGSVFFVSVLTNPEVYEFIGFVKSGNFFHSKKSRISKDSKSFLTFNWLNKYKENLPSYIKVLNMGKCMRCGRSLTTPESIRTGLGPECSRKLIE